MNRSWVQVLRGALNLPLVREFRRLATRYRPRFEQLEDRWTPSAIFTVNSPLDDPLGATTPGVYTLRDAINAVNADAADSAASPDVIRFAVPGGTPISLTADLPAISRPVLIDGSTQGAGGVTIVGSDAFGNVFSALDAESAVSMKSVTISSGIVTVGAGGALNVLGDLNLGDGAAVNNSGSIQVSGSVVAGQNVGFSNFDVALIDVMGDVTLGAGGYVYNGADFTSSDAATFVVGGNLSIGDNGFFFDIGDSAVSVGNDLAIGDGGFIYNGISDADSAVFQVGGSVTLGVSGGAADYVRNNGTSFFQAAGDFTLLGDSSYVMNGTSAADAATFVVGGSFELPGDADAAYNYGNGNFIVGSLQLGANGEFYDHSVLSVSGSSSTGTSTIRLFAGASLDVAVGSDFTVDAGGAIAADKGTSLTIEGDVTIDGGATVSADLLELSDAALVDIFGTLSANTLVIEGNARTSLETGGDASSALTIRITPYNSAYDGTTHQAAGTAITADGQDLSSLLSFRGTDHVNAGSYSADTWTFAGNSVYAGVTGAIDDEIAKADQTITVTAPTTATYGTSFLVSATASSGLGVDISASGVGAGSGIGSASISLTSGTGSVTVTFSQAGNDNYNAATVVVDTVTAHKANQTITVTQAAPATAASGAKFTVSATASSGLAVSIAASGALTGSGAGTASITVAGTSGSGTVTFSALGNDDYNAATTVVETTTVAATTPVSGAGITVVGNALYIVGGAKSNDQIEISAVGRSDTGSTGVKVTAVLDGKRVTTTYTQSFATITITGYAGSDNIDLASTLTIATVVHLGNGNNFLQLDNGNNAVTLGTGNNWVEAGNGTNIVAIGSAGVGGNNIVALGNGTKDAVTIAGNGNNSVAIGKGDNDTVTILGKGRNSVLIGDGKHDVVTLGDGTFMFRIGGLEWFLHRKNGRQPTHACRGWRLLDCLFADADRR